MYFILKMNEYQFKNLYLKDKKENIDNLKHEYDTYHTELSYL